MNDSIRVRLSFVASVLLGIAVPLFSMDHAVDSSLFTIDGADAYDRSGSAAAPVRRRGARTLSLRRRDAAFMFDAASAFLGEAAGVLSVIEARDVREIVASLIEVLEETQEDDATGFVSACLRQLNDLDEKIDDFVVYLKRKKLDILPSLVPLVNELKDKISQKDLLGIRTTILSIAVLIPLKPVVPLLKLCGTDPHIRGHLGRAPIHWAVARPDDDVRTVERLVRLYHSSVNITEDNPTKNTPLHLAAQAGNTAVARLLLRTGARSQEKNGNDDTPANLARRNGHHALARMLDQGRQGLDRRSVFSRRCTGVTAGVSAAALLLWFSSTGLSSV